MSVYFFKERLFADSSYMIFKTINKGWFHMEHGRPAHALTQVLPLIGYALNLPLKVLLILYSVGQVVLYYLLYLVFSRFLASRVAIIALLGVMLIGQSWLYYIPMLEITLGGALAVLVVSIMRLEKWKDDKWLILLLLSYWMILTSHPLNYLLAAIIVFADLLDQGWKPKLHYAMIAFFGIALFIEWLGHDAYEAQKIVGLSESGLVKLTSLSFMKDAFLLLIKNYWSIMILGIWMSVGFLRRKRVALSLIWPGSFLVLFLAAVYRWDISQDDWYTELVFQPWATISLILFCFYYLNTFSLKVQQNTQKAFALLFIGLAISIVYNSSFMTHRSTQLVNLTDHLQYQKIDKAKIDLRNIERPYNNWVWSAPVEALLLSAIDGPKESVSIITEEDLAYNYNKSRSNDSNFVFRKFDLMSYAELNPLYFHLEKGPYENVNTDYNLAEVEAMKNYLSILPATSDTLLRVPANSRSWVDVSIENTYYKTLPSAFENYLFVATHWYSADTMYQWDGIRTPLEIDIIGKHHQQILLETPKESGIYEVQFDLVKEGAYWLMLRPKYTVQVY